MPVVICDTFQRCFNLGHTSKCVHRRLKVEALDKMKQFALVTGASKGLGRAFSLELGSRGMNTILVSLPGEDIHLLNEEIIQKYGTTSVFFEVDLSDYDNVI